MLNIWTFLCGLLVVYLIYWYKKRDHIRAAALFPGPFALPILGNAVQLMAHKNDLFDFFGSYVWFYRRSFRLWIGSNLNICILEPQDVETVLSSMNHLEKSDQYDYLYDWIGRGLLTSFGNKWKKSRKILTPGFHFTILENFLDIFQKNGDILVEKLEEKIGPNFNVYEIIKLYALDNICEAAMGTQVDAQLNPVGDYARSIKAMCRIVFTRALSPWYWPDFIFHRSQLGKEQAKALSVIHGLTNKVIAERKELLKNTKLDEPTVDETGKKTRKVFIDILLQSSEEGGLTDEEIRQEVDTFMFEGHDTVTSAISFALLCLAENPDCQEKAYKEVMEIFGNDNRTPTYQDLQNLKYLELCIKETLRLYPSVPIFGRIVHEDVVLDEKATVPKGAQVLVAVPALHRRRHVWEKPDEFYPEHFELDACAKRHPYQYIPFSAGPRNCIGMRFAMLEMKATLSRILKNFKLLPANPPVPISLDVDLILVSGTGVNIRIVKR